MADPLAFLDGGGEMGARVRAHPWHETPLGPPQQWPAALRVVLRLMLDARQPALVLWGPSALCFCNDAAWRAFAPSGQPPAPGRAACDGLGAIWPVLGSLVDQAMRGDGGGIHENQPLTLERDGRAVEEHWTFSFVPVAHDGGIGGVFATAFDATKQVSDASRLAKQNAQRYSFFDRLPDFVGILRGPDHVYEYVNDAYEAFVGRGDLVGHPVRERFPDLAGQGFFEMLDGVRASGEAIVNHSMPIRFADELRFMDLRYDPIYAEDGSVDGIFVSGHDLTDRVRAETRRQVLAELSERLRDLGTPSEIALVASRLLGTTMSVTRAGYGTVDHATGVLSVDQDWHVARVAPLPATIPLAHYGTFLDDLRRGAVVAISDAEQDARTERHAPAIGLWNTRSFVNVPIVERGALVALLYVNDAEVRFWSAEDLAFLAEFAGRTRTAVERARSDLALRRFTAALEKQVEQRTAERDRLWETSEDLLMIGDYDAHLLSVSPSWTRVLGLDEATLLSEPFWWIIHPDDLDRVIALLRTMIETGQPLRYECRIAAADGSYRTISWSLVPAPETRRVHAVGRDVTADREAERVRAALEEQLRQAQKMEAVGQLTGGIAHDFNNMVLGITGSLQIAARRLASGRADEIAPFLARAKAAADRAAALTHRLLAFSRRQPLRPRAVDVNGLVTSLGDLIRGTIGERIVLTVAPAVPLWACRCDPNQLESSLLNLVINARDAMPGGGAVTITTGNATLTPGDVAGVAPDVAPGDYVCVSVRDTGTGMAPETIAKAFDPFFTTKPIGRGTGLGLSMVYGFARQSEGYARIDSRLGEGTTIRLYLPRTLDEPEQPQRAEPARLGPSGGGETILVVEDDATVRTLIVEELGEHGYRVLQAPDGQTGLALLRSTIRIDLLLTDLGLPDIGGSDIAAAARDARPALKVLFMTGYAEKAAAASGFLRDGMELIAKPFAIEDLTHRIAGMIAG